MTTLDSSQELAAFVSPGLVQKLSELFPDTLPRMQIPHEQIMIRVGQQQVLDKLRAALEEIEADPLNSTKIQSR